MKPFLLLRFQGEPTAAGLLRCADHFPRLWRVPRWGVLLDGTQLARGLVPEDAELRQFFEIEGGVKVGRGSIVELAFFVSVWIFGRTDLARTIVGLDLCVYRSSQSYGESRRRP